MGESQSVNNQITKEAISPIESLDKLCAYAMSIGMSYDEYWYGDPERLKFYIKADELRLKRKNQEMWLQGLYTHIAVADLVPVINPFSKEHKARPYLKEPIPITEKEKAEYEERRIQKFVNYLDKLAVKKTEV